VTAFPSILLHGHLQWNRRTSFRTRNRFAGGLELAELNDRERNDRRVLWIIRSSRCLRRAVDIMYGVQYLHDFHVAGDRVLRGVQGIITLDITVRSHLLIHRTCRNATGETRPLDRRIIIVTIPHSLREYFRPYLLRASWRGAVSDLSFDVVVVVVYK